jgi:hypothetical protein
MISIYSHIALDPFSTLAYFLMFAIYPTMLFIGLRIWTKRNLFLYLIPLAFGPLMIWGFEMQTKHSLLRAELISIGSHGTLVIERFQATSSVHNHTHVSEALATVQALNSKDSWPIRFIWGLTVYCRTGEAHALMANQSYPVLFNTLAPDQFCVDR